MMMKSTLYMTQQWPEKNTGRTTARGGLELNSKFQGASSWATYGVPGAEGRRVLAIALTTSVYE